MLNDSACNESLAIGPQSLLALWDLKKPATFLQDMSKQAEYFDQEQDGAFSTKKDEKDRSGSSKDHHNTREN